MNKGTPQIEDGYTRIANELLEALAATKISGSELRMMLAIIRLTYGYNTSEARITANQLSNILGVLPQHIFRTLKDLENGNFIFRNNGNIRINKHYKEWNSTKTGTTKIGTTKTGTKSIPNSVVNTTKTGTVSFPYIKENIKENKKKPAAHSQTLKKAASQQNDATQYGDATQNDDEPYETYLEELTRKGVTIIRHKDSGGGLPF